MTFLPKTENWNVTVGTLQANDMDQRPQDSLPTIFTSAKAMGVKETQEPLQAEVTKPQDSRVHGEPGSGPSKSRWR